MRKIMAGLALMMLIGVFTSTGCSSIPLMGGVAQTDASPTETIPAVTSARNEFIVAEAKVEAAERRALMLEIGGAVQEILVEEGDEVEAGAPLVRLDSAELARAVASAEQNLIIQQATLDTLLNGAAAADIAAAEAALTSAQQTLQRVEDGPNEEDIAAAQASLEAASETYQKLVDGPGDLDLAPARARLSAAEAALREAQARYDEVSWRNDLGMLPQSTALMYATIDYEAALAAYEDAAGGADADQIAGARASVAGAEASLQRLLDSPTAADLASARAAVVQAQSRLTTLRDGATDEDIAMARAAVSQAQINLDAAHDALRKATLAAPFAGVVTLVQAEEGDLLPAGRVVVTLATIGQLQVRTVDMVERDIVYVSVGQPATVKVDALPGVKLAGHVSEINLEPVDYRGDVTYPVVVALDETHPRLRLGMTMQVELLRGE
jgi:HlyD family secretion protein